MAATATPAFAQTPKNTCVTIVAADTTTLKTAYTGGTNGSRITQWLISSTDTSNRDINVYLTISATDYLITTISIPLNSGNTNAITPVNILAHAQMNNLQYDSNGNPCLYIANGTTLKIAATTTVTAAKTITSAVTAEDF